MADPVRIRDIPHGITYHQEESTNTDLSGVSSAKLRQCAFRSKNAEFRAKTSQIRAPAELYERAYNSCMDELKRRDEITVWEGIESRD